MSQSRLERQLELGAGRMQARMASADHLVQPHARASASTRPVFSKADEDYTADFLVKLSNRAGIPSTTDPDEILAGLDRRINALTAAKTPVTQHASADAKFEAETEQWAKWVAAH